MALLRKSDFEEADWNELATAWCAVRDRAKEAPGCEAFRSADVGRVWYPTGDGGSDERDADELNELQKALMGAARRVAAKLQPASAGGPAMAWVPVLGCLQAAFK